MIILNFILTIITFTAKSIKSGAKGIFGIITAILDYITYAIFVKLFGFSIVFSNFISWIIAESFAFGSNKIITYKGTGKKLVIKEYIEFMLARTFVLVMDTTILKITVDILNLEELVMKVISMLSVMILGYVLNRYLVFRKSEYISKVQLFKNIKSKFKKINHNKKDSE